MCRKLQERIGAAEQIGKAWICSGLGCSAIEIYEHILLGARTAGLYYFWYAQTRTQLLWVSMRHGQARTTSLTICKGQAGSSTWLLRR